MHIRTRKDDWPGLCEPEGHCFTYSQENSLGSLIRGEGQDPSGSYVENKDSRKLVNHSGDSSSGKLSWVGEKVRLPTLPVGWTSVDRTGRWSSGFLNNGR